MTSINNKRTTENMYKNKKNVRLEGRMESITFSNVLSSGVFRALSELVFSEAPPPPPRLAGGSGQRQTGKKVQVLQLL